MKNYEYKTLNIKSKFRSNKDIEEMDRVINESAAKGWELIATSPLATSIWDHGKTSEILLTFRREVGN